MHLLPGAILKPDSGIAITIDGAIIAGIEQIFDTSAGGSFVIGNQHVGVFPQWFGATGDGSTNDRGFIKSAIDAVNAAGGGKVILPFTASGYNVVSIVGSSTPGIDIPPGVLVLMDQATLIFDDGDYVTVKIGGQLGNFEGGLIGGRIRCGDGTTGSATVGILIQNCRSAIIRPNQIIGNYSEAQIKLFAANGEKTLFNKITGHIPSGGPTVIGIIADNSGTGFCNANDIDVDSTDVPIGVELKGVSSTNIIRGRYENTGGTAIIIGDGTNDANHNMILWPRIEDYTTFINIKANSVGTQIWIGHPMTTSLVDNGTETNVLTTSGDTGRSHAAYKNFSSGNIVVANGATVEFARFSTAANRNLRVFSGQCHKSDGTNAATFELEVFNVTDASVLKSFNNSSYERGFPLASAQLGVTKTYALRLKNTSGAQETMYGSVTLSVDGE
ncbi:hypothetical protein LCGC14_2023820 [marine sediment metagenome]|uniref:Pectate lyase superfamily protein domain-containing protein n=1 Tax=marine sediment metagenome TaxID=412755 RepID=A0A0F9HA38_9ZZZZ